MLDFLRKFIKVDDIGLPPYEYELLISLDESEYPKYLKRMFKMNTGENLNLKNPKTFNEKIQWLKLYDATPLKTQLTDKVLVRDWIKEKIGEEYLKPVLQICDNFGQIDFDRLPERFIIKANHGSKWHYKIRDKKELLDNKNLFSYMKNRFNSWLDVSFFPWAGFEMQYKGIIPKVIIEPLLVSEENPFPIEYEIYCFNGEPKIFQKIKYQNTVKYCVYGEDYNIDDICFNGSYIREVEPVDDSLKKAVELSKILSNGFKFVRVDWLLYENKIYFNEMTFTPFSGFYAFPKAEWNLRLGKMLNLK